MDVVLIWLVMAFLYFSPTIMAWLRDSPFSFAIFLLNLLLGWTGIGWVAAMVWAAASKGRQ